MRLQQRSPSPKRSRPKLRRKRRASPRYVDVSRLERPTASSIARSAARDAGRLDEGIAPDLAAELAYFRAASARHRPMVRVRIEIRVRVRIRVRIILTLTLTLTRTCTGRARRLAPW